MNSISGLNPSNLFPNVPYFPLEISEKIVSYLNIQELVNCELISRDWKFLTNSSFLWKNLYFGAFPSNRPQGEIVNWKDRFQKSKSLAKFGDDIRYIFNMKKELSERVEYLSTIFIKTNVHGAWEKKCFLSSDKVYNHTNSVIETTEKRILLRDPHTILEYLFEDIVDNIPQFTEQKVAREITLADMGDHPMMTGFEGKNHRYVVVQVYTDKEHKNKELIRFSSWIRPDGVPNFLYFGIFNGQEQMLSLFHGCTITYIEIFNALKSFIREGFLDANNWYLKVAYEK